MRELSLSQLSLHSGTPPVGWRGGMRQCRTCTNDARAAQCVRSNGRVYICLTSAHFVPCLVAPRLRMVNIYTTPPSTRHAGLAPGKQVDGEVLPPPLTPAIDDGDVLPLPLPLPLPPSTMTSITCALASWEVGECSGVRHEHSHPSGVSGVVCCSGVD
mmetsp:Transcript_63395/g.125356  ORF Transcript_63395/g.125356 Transcript_63395/m.125356 type:complete len:158 (-) Transcript_63395:251-724(-)